MLPSSTVENYLKAIYLGVGGLILPQRLLPMGQLASSLGVAPGTATTMVKTLADSGLVEYEPYVGVRLTRAGEKLAALVLRRHRLIELFLVQVMGLRWDEVHEDAEQLEHVVSERLVDRMDEMLGRPDVDPHGDPIPDPDGIVKPQESQSLLTCPLHTRVTVTRVMDQDKAFLRFIANNDLKPGQSIEVEDRDAASDSVRVLGRNDERITIGTRAASKLLVQVARAIALVLLLSSRVLAQDAAAPDSARPFEILDNSFFVEEAFNQPADVFQNIFGAYVSSRHDWVTAFTQEWPLFGHKHQISYTVPLANLGAGTGLGDAAVHYRLQAIDEGPRRPAFSPRVSLIVPSGSTSRGLGDGHLGWQVNLPFSKQVRDVYFHWNAGFTQFPSVHSNDVSYNLVTPQVSASGIVRVRPMFNVMLEAIVQGDAAVDGTRVRHDASLMLSPGFRAGWNSGDTQTVIGVALPVLMSNDTTHVGVFGYFSYELPFRRRP